MNTDAAFAASARPSPRVILRVPLLTYSLGHEIILLDECNPLLFLPADFDPLPESDQRCAIMRAVQVCSRTWAQSFKRDKWIRLWGWLIRNEDFALAIADFRNYRKEGSTFPRLTEKTGDKGRNLGGSLTARLSMFSRKLYGDAYLDQPLGMLQHLYFTEAEAEGSCDIENSLERQIREEIEQHQADFKREQEAKLASP